MNCKVKKEKVVFFQERILEWYKAEGRSFPWRKKSANNYQRIISEVLLQRTKAETVAKYFPFFIKKYPSWQKVAEASEEELQEALKPFGLYKQRAKRLYNLGQQLKQKKGKFPNDRNKVEEMDMMGQYITNAFELFILNKSSPLLDSNMARVLERFFGQRDKVDIRYDKYLQDLSNQVVNHSNSKELNWGVLDLASKICLKKTPKCELCPLKRNCKFRIVFTQF
jgi:A/G-specific adenine glycosylase